MHETSWKTQAVGKTEMPGDNTAKGWSYLSSNFQQTWSITELCSALGASLSEERTERAAIPTSTWSSLSPDRFTEKEVTEPSSKRTSGCWLYHRPLDVRKNCQVNRDAFWCSISPASCVAYNEKPAWLELPETGAEISSKGRRANPEVETLPLAPYKKKPNGWEPTWYSSTKVVSCSFLMLKGLGHPVVKHLYCITCTNRTEFLPSVHSPFLRKENELDFISDSGKGIYPVIWWLTFSGNFSDISVAPYSFFGIKEQFICILRLRHCFIFIPGHIMNFFRLMLQNLIQLNIYGINMIHHWLMALQKIFTTFAMNYIRTCIKFVNPRSFFGHVFMPASFPGNVNNCIHYLCETQ